MPGLKKGHRKHTPYGRSYEVLAGPFKTNDPRFVVYVVRDGDDGIVQLIPAGHLEDLCDEPPVHPEETT